MPDEAIDARAERLAQEHWHWHCPNGDEWYPGSPLDEERGVCTDDHRTPAEQRDAALDAAAVLWAYFRGEPIMNRKLLLTLLYHRIQRTEGPQ